MTARVVVPAPQVAEHAPHAAADHKQLLLATHALLAAGVVTAGRKSWQRASAAVSPFWFLQSTCRVCVDSPHVVPQADHWSSATQSVAVDAAAPVAAHEYEYTQSVPSHAVDVTGFAPAVAVGHMASSSATVSAAGA